MVQAGFIILFSLGISLTSELHEFILHLFLLHLGTNGKMAALYKCPY